MDHISEPENVGKTQTIKVKVIAIKNRKGSTINYFSNRDSTLSISYMVIRLHVLDYMGERSHICTVASVTQKIKQILFLNIFFDLDEKYEH